ncbi:MAG: uroporphyrinogen decarboxylase family protein [Verrucomicrobiota bacterium]|nr:uroporphyrinogen decarboxylase family protein [Verrucomicrobiota bacterium]
MQRKDYLELARRGRGLPIGADLILHQPGAAPVDRYQGEQLGAVMVRAAERFHSPLAFSLMDLTLEKKMLLDLLGVDAPEVHDGMLVKPISPERRDAVMARLEQSLPKPMIAQMAALEHVVKQGALEPVGMHIGPFSLVSKLLSDPITPIYMAGTGATAEDDDQVEILESALDLTTRFLARYSALQIEAGAKAIFVAEPAANKVFFSPNQLAAGAPIFERYVMEPNRTVRNRMSDGGAELIFHCCGELIDSMVTQFGSLRPVILSLGSSRHLWEDAALLPKDVVLYGNLPSKQFYSDELTPPEKVREMARALKSKMASVDHPFILGSECDILYVPDTGDRILTKADIIAAS